MTFNPICIIVSLVGLYLLVRLRFFFIVHPIRTSKYLLRTLSRRDTARSLILALSGTLGVGNIFGVSLGLILGGAGSVFWMLVSAIFAAVLKYAEVTLSSDGIMRDDAGTHGGMHLAARATLGKLGTPVAVIYTASVLLLSFSMGASLQTVTFVSSVSKIFNTPPTLTAALFAILVFFAVVGGTKIIERVTEIIIPLTTIIYILLTLSVIVICRDRLSDAIRLIFVGAFTARGALGGVFGFLTSRALSEGFARGLLSNEAGAGTSSIAHARGSTLNPAMSGLMGIVEVLFDTVILCTLTALSVLVSVGDISIFTDGMSLVFAAFVGTLGIPAGLLLTFCILSFAFSTVICWYFYGSEAARVLFGLERPVLFLPGYLFAVVFGSRIDSGILVFITDALLLIMTSVTAILLVKNSDRILILSENGGVLSKHRNKYKRFKVFDRKGKGKEVR